MTRIVRWMGVSFLIALCLSTWVSAATPESINLRETVVVQVVRKVHTAVVNISTERLVEQRGRGGRGNFNNNSPPIMVPGRALGSGFIIHPDGYVITNNHVVERARTIEVQLDDGRKFTGEVVSTDPDADLALIRIRDRKPFPFLELGDSQGLMIGEPAIAIGNPFGFGHSVSTGIVSAVHRDLKDGAGQVDSAYENLVQTDAAINPGNSGGPLLNAYGQVIGINTAIESLAQNIGFAIPVNRLRDLIPELMDPTQATKMEVPIKFTEQRTIVEPDQIECEIFESDQRQHIVASIDGKAPKNIVEAYAMLLSAKPGIAMNVKFADGQTKPIVPKMTPPAAAIILAKDKLGLNVELMTPTIAQEHNLTSEDGIFVISVDPGGLAERYGVKPGDVLNKFRNVPIKTLADLANQLSQLPSVGPVRIGIMRDDRPKFLDLIMGTTPKTTDE